MSTILLAKQLGENPVLLDDYRARKLAKSEGLEILGSVGLLEIFYLRRYLSDIRGVFRHCWYTTFMSISDCWIVVCDPWASRLFKPASRCWAKL
jgi:predicted nucleic acid-binding protein